MKRTRRGENTCVICDSPRVVWLELHPFDPLGVAPLPRCGPCLKKQARAEAAYVKRRGRKVVAPELVEAPLNPTMVP